MNGLNSRKSRRVPGHGEQQLIVSGGMPTALRGHGLFKDMPTQSRGHGTRNLRSGLYPFDVRPGHSKKGKREKGKRDIQNRERADSSRHSASKVPSPLDGDYGSSGSHSATSKRACGEVGGCGANS
jgi:hypothetical protein